MLGLVTLLYGLKNDPGETTNVADRYPEIVRRLEIKHGEWNAQLLPPDGAILPGIRSTLTEIDGEAVQLIF